MVIDISEQIKPKLSEPFPDIPEFVKDDSTGILIPKDINRNLEWRSAVLKAAEDDVGMQSDLLAACRESLNVFVNLFVWTYHQFEVYNGMRVLSSHPHAPFITWNCQDVVLDEFQQALGIVKSELGKGKTITEAVDVLINKSRDMGASWLCIAFIHWLWLFRPDSQMLEMSRIEDYVDKRGNMKALFQRHDYINDWLPEWMLPPDCLYGQKERTSMHMYNRLNGSCIDGEATTKHAASGDRRLVCLLDEFAKVENGAAMRSATRDAALVRLVNSTVAGPGTEYSKWKNSGQIKVVPLMWWDHPEKGRDRYLRQHDITGAWKIRSPWYDAECKVRSPKEVAQELDAEDLEAGSQFFTSDSVLKHKVMFGAEPRTIWDIKLNKKVTEDSIKDVIRTKNASMVDCKRVLKGSLRVWVELIKGRPDQSKDYSFGIDVSKGQGASNSVISIRCTQTKEKIAEWRNANTPPHEMAAIVVALAVWCGGRGKLPFLKWEMNGPGWDLGRLLVRVYKYPYYYKRKPAGKVHDKKSDSYGWFASRDSKQELLTAYDRALAHLGIINHSIWGLEEVERYIYYDSGEIGPSELVEETAAAKKTHGDVVIADALTLTGRETRLYKNDNMPKTTRCAAYRRKIAKRKKTAKTGFGSKFDLRR